MRQLLKLGATGADPLAHRRHRRRGARAMSERRAREVAEYAQRLHARGWVANHDGNVTVRDGQARALSWRRRPRPRRRQVRADGLVVVDDAGAQVGGRGKPFSEIGLHLTVYRQSPRRQRGHPRAPADGDRLRGGRACRSTRRSSPRRWSRSAPGVPTVPFAAPGADACRALAAYTRGHDAVLLGGHGVLAWGPDLETGLSAHGARRAPGEDRAGGAAARRRAAAAVVGAAEADGGARQGRASARVPPSGAVVGRQEGRRRLRTCRLPAATSKSTIPSARRAPRCCPRLPSWPASSGKRSPPP